MVGTHNKNKSSRTRSRSNLNPVEKLSMQVRLGKHGHNIAVVENTVAELEGICNQELVMELRGIVAQIKYDLQNSNFDRERMMQYTNAFNTVISKYSTNCET